MDAYSSTQNRWRELIASSILAMSRGEMPAKRRGSEREGGNTGQVRRMEEAGGERADDEEGTVNSMLVRERSSEEELMVRYELVSAELSSSDGEMKVERVTRSREREEEEEKREAEMMHPFSVGMFTEVMVQL